MLHACTRISSLTDHLNKITLPGKALAAYLYKHRKHVDTCLLDVPRHAVFKELDLRFSQR